MIFYHDACPYGRLKMPDEVWDYVSSSWAYIPDATKRRADVVNYQRIEDVGVARFCERADEWFNENHPYGNPLEARRERLPEFGIAVTNASRETNTRYLFFTVVYNGTAEDRGTTEWTCTLSNAKNTKVYEKKLRVDNVKANSRVITRNVFHYDGNADNVQCK
jgi:hypothetical protein